MSATQFDTVKEYLDSFPDDVAEVLRQVQDRIRAAAPGADEVISYGIPTMRLEGRNLVHFAGWRHHVSIYPVPDDVSSLEPEIDRYLAGRGTLKLPLSEPMPLELIEKVAHLLVAQNTR
ncbi:DUF1801 domain-containing protein [Nocardioides sp. HDW12B]|uniref:iron chaperone n=1 Tax=Nocardioides sp. HDW12B TaxID=2714939 RepID=UPI001981F718|nr:DUF1801 domain-containing protein [Nocardioides sp. HDW12B]